MLKRRGGGSDLAVPTPGPSDTSLPATVLRRLDAPLLQTVVARLFASPPSRAGKIGRSDTMHAEC